MNKDMTIAVLSMMFISASLGFMACFMMMGGFDVEAKSGTENNYGGNVTIEVHYDTPQVLAAAGAEEVIEEAVEMEQTSLGKFKLTAYCPCEKCCGVNTGITATGTKATEGRTIGVDPKVIPYGSKVLINGKEYIAEDTGDIHGKHIDIFFENHDDAIAFGVQHEEVFLLEEKE